MRLVFMGTPDFAKACLETLYTDGFDIAAVYTKIDTPKNRGMKLIPSPVKEYALSVGLPVYQPQSFRDEEAVRQLRELKPDLLVVVAYGKKFCRRLCWIFRNTAASTCTQAFCRSCAVQVRCSGQF